MKDFQIEIDGNNFNFNLLKLKEGQFVKSPQGDLVSTAVLGVKDFSINVNDYELSATMIVGAWLDESKYKGYLKRESFCNSYFTTSLLFDKRNIPLSLLNNIAFDDAYLFGIEFTQIFMQMLLSLPDGEGGTFGDRWAIINE
jgi:hypothetical protein